MTNLYWGDTHLHTSNSIDAFDMGDRSISPVEAFRFARGEHLVSETGVKVKLRRPLDFLVVADHAEYLGGFALAANQDPEMLATPLGQEWAGIIASGRNGDLLKTMTARLQSGNPELQSIPTPVRQRSLFVDMRGTYEASLVIEAIAKRGSTVTIITPFYTWGANMGFTNVHDYMLLLPKLGCEWQTTTALEKVRDGKATFRDAYTGRATTAEFDFIVAGVHPKPCDELQEVLAKYAKVIAVGDVVAPRTVMEAIREGDRAGRTI
jgi:hypothetical protein